MEKKNGDPKGTRTPVAGMKTRCPRPLDDGVARGCSANKEFYYNQQTGISKSKVVPSHFEWVACFNHVQV